MTRTCDLPEFSGSARQAVVTAGKFQFLPITLQDISQLLNTGLDVECLAICVKLCENGVNPEALATVVRELRKQSEAIKREVRRAVSKFIENEL